MTTDDINELWEERAGIREFDGGMSRADAEVAAWADVAEILNRRAIGEKHDG